MRINELRDRCAADNTWWCAFEERDTLLCQSFLHIAHRMIILEAKLRLFPPPVTSRCILKPIQTLYHTLNLPPAPSILCTLCTSYAGLVASQICQVSFPAQWLNPVWLQQVLAASCSKPGPLEHRVLAPGPPGKSVAEHLRKVFSFLEKLFFEISTWHSPSGHLMFSQVSSYERCLLYLNEPIFSYNILFSITYL